MQRVTGDLLSLTGNREGQSLIRSVVNSLNGKRTREVKRMDDPPRATPRITVHNRQRAMRIPLASLQEFAQRALGECLKIPKKNRRGLAGFADLRVILVSNRRMAELHRRFLHLPGPTDVITFQHGEIFVSAQTARSHARRFGNSLEGELRLYIAHGLLHLHGFDDKDPAKAAEMERAQEKLVLL
jgi:probable rRNA maturation factor